MPRRELHELFCEEFGRGDVSADNIKSLCSRRGWKTGRDGRLQKGNVPFNKGQKGFCAPGSEKGWFKKGTLGGRAAEIAKPIGAERLSKEGYLQRKINNDLPFQRRWQAVHVMNWEAINGPIPKGMCLKCLDGDRTNVEPANWELIPRSLLPRLAGRWSIPYDQAEPEVKPALLALAKLKHTAKRVRRAGTVQR